MLNGWDRHHNWQKFIKEYTCTLFQNFTQGNAVKWTCVCLSFEFWYLRGFGVIQ